MGGAISKVALPIVKEVIPVVGDVIGGVFGANNTAGFSAMSAKANTGGADAAAPRGGPAPTLGLSLGDVVKKHVQKQQPHKANDETALRKAFLKRVGITLKKITFKEHNIVIASDWEADKWVEGPVEELLLEVLTLELPNGAGKVDFQMRVFDGGVLERNGSTEKDAFYYWPKDAAEDEDTFRFGPFDQTHTDEQIIKRLKKHLKLLKAGGFPDEQGEEAEDEEDGDQQDEEGEDDDEGDEQPARGRAKPNGATKKPKAGSSMGTPGKSSGAKPKPKKGKK